MAYWLLKTEPSTWSWDDQTAARAQRTHWDGVRNHQAKQHLNAMKKGDRCFFYHSVKEKRIVGVVEVVKEAYPDPSDEKGQFVMVDVKAVGPLTNPVELADIKAEPKLEDMVLVNNSRLSVQPVTAAEWKQICKMGGFKA
ncbi:EVE domain-containing protein [Mucisphaera calidilacus]|uniref:EVE domain protein n=1 Tax=Mucisphaera calidilacus TaxID=2527982 RepID=A0A518BV78_9BACT|nr:EVE domain-containing protein [Mucisphaera calidilacus]QDU70876.1 EVE domain protein [Mucisphaera calidilacus]